MRIRYNIEPSRFDPFLRQALEESPDALGEGRPVVASVPLLATTKRGFERRVRVTIGDDAESFETDWNGDASRFGSKLRAAATVLRDLGYRGEFSIEHEARLIRIERAIG